MFFPHVNCDYLLKSSILETAGNSPNSHIRNSELEALLGYAMDLSQQNSDGSL